MFSAPDLSSLNQAKTDKSGPASRRDPIAPALN